MTKQNDKISIWTRRYRASCRDCGQIDEFLFPLYIHESYDTEFENKIIKGEFGEVTCSNCETSIYVRLPLIYDSSHYGLLICVVHNDSENLKELYKEYFEKSWLHLDPDIGEQARKKPFTFVLGWDGFSTLLKYLKDMGPSKEIMHEDMLLDNKSFSISHLDGYIYGKLFFHYPDESVIQEIISTFIRSAENHRVNKNLEQSYEALVAGIDAIGATSLWLVQELGTTALQIGKMHEAKRWLKAALTLQHKWILPTLSFVDATPRQRIDGPTQDPDLPHSSPVSSRDRITRIRHAVVGYFPPTTDFNLWHFPQLENELISNVLPSIQQHMTMYGTALGEMEHSLDLYGLNSTINAFSSLYSLEHKFFDLKKYLRTEELPTYDEDFRKEYTLRRWRLPRNIEHAVQNSSFEIRMSLAKKYGEIMGKLGRQKYELKSQDDLPNQIGKTELPFLKYYYNKERRLFWIDQGLFQLFQDANYFINICPKAEQDELMRIRLQTEIDYKSDTTGVYIIS